MKIEVGKEYELNTGDKVRIVDKMNRVRNPYLGTVTPKIFGEEFSLTFPESGRCSDNCYIVPPDQFSYFNVYDNDVKLSCGMPHKDRDDADKSVSSCSKRVGCIKVKLERRFDD